jgi:hypothetical protein
MYPWNTSTCTGTCATNVDDVYAFVSADTVGVGICGVSGAACKTSATQGELLAALELQNTFLNKGWINASSAQARLWVGKAANSSSSVFVCWSPKSNSNRQVLLASVTSGVNRLFNATAGFTSSGLPATGNCTTVTETGWTTGACVECVPE